MGPPWQRAPRQDLDLASRPASATASDRATTIDTCLPHRFRLPDHGKHSRGPFATAALVAFVLSGYAGYRYLTWPVRWQTRNRLPRQQTTPPISESRDQAGVPRATEPHSLPLPVRGGAFSPSFAAQPRTLLFHAGPQHHGSSLHRNVGRPRRSRPMSRRCSTSPRATITPACRPMESGSRLTPTATASAAYTSPTGSGDQHLPRERRRLRRRAQLVAGHEVAGIHPRRARPAERVESVDPQRTPQGRAVARHRLPIRPGLGRVVVS